MTVPVQVPLVSYTGNGVTAGPYTFPFRILVAEDLKVTLNGEITEAYSVSGIGADQGAVSFNVAPAAGTIIIIYRQVELDREKDYQFNGDLRADTLNADFDRIWMALQDTADSTTRAIQFPVEEFGTDGTLPPASERANTMLGFDVLGGMTEYPVPASVGAGDLRDEVFVDGIDYTAGTTTTLTLSRTYSTKANLSVSMQGVAQDPRSYSLAGKTLTFDAPIPLGVTVIWVKGGTTLSVGVPPDGSVDGNKLAANAILDRHVSALAAIDAAKLGFVQTGIAGAVQRTVKAKLMERLDVRDFGALGDGTGALLSSKFSSLAMAQVVYPFATTLSDTLDWVGCQAALNASSLTGRVAWQTTGRFMHSKQLKITTDPLAVFPSPRGSLVGDGPNNSVNIWNSGIADGGGIAVIGEFTGSAVISHQFIRDLSILKGDTLGVGVTAVELDRFSMENVYVQGFSTGYLMSDVLSSNFYNCQFRFNNLSTQALRTSFTQPNALAFFGCTFGNNLNYGLDMKNVGTLQIIGGSIENNNGGTEPVQFGIRLTYDTAAIEASAFVRISGVYFENNPGDGTADIWYVNNSCPGTIMVDGCTFNRGNMVFATNNIRIETSGGFRQKAVIVGNGFRGFNGYVPSAARKYIGIVNPTEPLQLIEYGNYFDSPLEAPDYSGQGAMSPSPVCALSNASAWVVFNGTTGAIIQSFNVASVVRTGVGTYTITYAHPLSGAVNVPLVQIPGAGFAFPNSQNANGCSISTTNTSVVSIDVSQVYVGVFGGAQT